MGEIESQFLNKDITIRKTDGTNVRGICILDNGIGLTVRVLNTNRIVFVPFQSVSEVITSE